MRHLIRRIIESKSEVLGRFEIGNKSFKMITSNSRASLAINGHDILFCGDVKNNMDRIAHLIRDILLHSVPEDKSDVIKVYTNKDQAMLTPIIDDLKSVNNGVKLLEPVDEITVEDNLYSDIPKSPSKDSLKEFSTALCDLQEILRVCREDCLSLTDGHLINTMWGAKPMQQVITNLHNEILKNSAWDKVEFYICMLLKSVESFINKVHMNLSGLDAENKKVINKVLIPNIIQNFDQIKDVVSSTLITLSNIIYIDEVFKRITRYPANWFINGNMLEDLKEDYNKLIMFVLRIPGFESDVIYPLDIMRHSFVNECVR